MADHKGQFEAPNLENITVSMAFALAAKWYVEEAGLQVPNGDLGFRCSVEMCRRPVVPVPSHSGQPAHFEHLEQNPDCPLVDRLMTESRISTVAESWCTVEAAAAIGRNLGRNLGNGNSASVPVPRPRKPTLDNSRAAVAEPYDEESAVVGPAVYLQPTRLTVGLTLRSGLRARLSTSVRIPLATYPLARGLHRSVPPDEIDRACQLLADRVP